MVNVNFGQMPKDNAHGGTILKIILRTIFKILKPIIRLKLVFTATALTLSINSKIEGSISFCQWKSLIVLERFRRHLRFEQYHRFHTFIMFGNNYSFFFLNFITMEFLFPIPMSLSFTFLP